MASYFIPVERAGELHETLTNIAAQLGEQTLCLRVFIPATQVPPVEEVQPGGNYCTECGQRLAG